MHPQHLSFEKQLGYCADGTYPIILGTSLFTSYIFKQIDFPSDILIVTDEQVAAHYSETVKACLHEVGCSRVEIFVLPVGEQFKSLERAQQLWEYLLTHRFTRDCALIALGGGVIGDLTGFVASTFLRGVTFFQMPTTLLAQVDASIGGKTAVNHSLGKNLIGTFYSPSAVLSNIDCLQTLSEYDYFSAMAEVIKYALVAAPDFLDWIEAHQTGLCRREPLALQSIVARCSQLKNEIVAKDAQDNKDVRVSLNFGHTVGHAIEAAMGYGGISHGQAVSIGMMVALQLSQRVFDFPIEKINHVRNLLQRFSLLVEVPAALSVDSLINYMQQDKKNQSGAMRFVLLEALGQPIVVDDLSCEMLRFTLNRVCASQEVC